MAKLLSHRGPDSQGCHFKDGFGVSHCRLAIIDSSPNSNQPMTNEYFTLVYNGEIYNWKELRQEYGFDASEVCSDTQLLFKILQIVNLKTVVPKLRGIFAFAFVDKKHGTTSLVRDRFGTKPIYSTYQNSVRYFSSEIKAFRDIPSLRLKLNIQGIRNYLTFQNNFSGGTIFESVELLKPGTVTIIKHENPEVLFVENLFPDFPETETGLGVDEAREEVARLLDQSITRNLVSDVEIGGFLSSGIDSSLIASYSSRSRTHFKTFTIGFQTEGASRNEIVFDESRNAMLLAEEIGVQNHSKMINERDMFEVIDAVSWTIEDPCVGQSYPNYFAAELASKSVRVCLAGTGGDEIFGGYPWRYDPVLRLENRSDQSKELLNFWHRLGSIDEISALLGISSAEHEAESLRVIETSLGQFTKTSEALTLNDLLSFEQKTFLHGLLIVEDKISMRHSLEVRVPYLDEDLANFASQLPGALKYDFKLSQPKNKITTTGKLNSRADGKRVLRDIARTMIPSSANLRKQGFSAPDATWFKNDKQRIIQNRLLNPDNEIWRYLNYEVGKTLINDHLGGRSNRRLLIWSLLTLESTIRQFEL
jgi:asparagine synthase (glutamine-hydrolysing)